MSIDKIEIDPGTYFAARGGIDFSVPQAGSPMPGQNAPSLLANDLQSRGIDLPQAKNDIGSLVSQKPAISLPGRKMGG